MYAIKIILFRKNKNGAIEKSVVQSSDPLVVSTLSEESTSISMADSGYMSETCSTPSNSQGVVGQTNIIHKDTVS